MLLTRLSFIQPSLWNCLAQWVTLSRWRPIMHEFKCHKSKFSLFPLEMYFTLSTCWFQERIRE